MGLDQESPADGHGSVELPYVRQPVHFGVPVRYAHGPDSFPQPGVPTGTIHEHALNTSDAFPGMRRRYWVYVPAQYDDTAPASVMIFQDGWMYLDPDGEIRAGVVLDNLIHRGEVPVTVVVFVDPGEPDNRNVEYDAFSGAYATFLSSEILPAVQARYRISEDPNDRAIGGGSSGGSCALTAAWTRPDLFRRVLSLLGSFAQLEGGNRYPTLIATEPIKPLRIFMQAATRDLGWNEPEWNWLAENLRVAAALPRTGTTFASCLGTGDTTQTTAVRFFPTRSGGFGEAPRHREGGDQA